MKINHSSQQVGEIPVKGAQGKRCEVSSGNGENVSPPQAAQRAVAPHLESPLQANARQPIRGLLQVIYTLFTGFSGSLLIEGPLGFPFLPFPISNSCVSGPPKPVLIKPLLFSDAEQKLFSADPDSDSSHYKPG